ncbi:MAG: hypothetical protein AAF702_33815 [Chloroflexota bacterium]
MTQTTIPYPASIFKGYPRQSIWDHLQTWLRFLPLLVAAALVADLLTPFLIWKRILPGPARFFGDLIILSMIGHCLWLMLRLDKIPSAFLLIIALSVVGGTVAWHEEQSWQATAWGIWLMFKYPMIGIYAYLHQGWLPDFPKRYVYFLFGLLLFETGFQGIQFILGQAPGDDLAGTFGRHGVAPLFMVIALAACIAFGHWLATNNWWLLTGAIILGVISSVLGEMKIFPVAVLALALICVGIQVVRNGKIGQALLIIAGLVIAAPIFLYLYNTLVADVGGTRRLEEYLDFETTERYLQNTDLTEDGIYYFGRGFAMTYAWNAIQRDRTTLLFGYGIGARADSSALGILGQALIQSDYGRTTGGTSILVLLQELGLIGIGVLAIFVTFHSLQLYHDVRLHTDVYAKILCYGLLLFSIMWPFWIWYTKSWGLNIVMILYWVAVGYTFRHRAHVDSPPMSPVYNGNIQ